MSNDRELLELAAKAAGVEILCWDTERSAMKVPGSPSRWNPLTDDGDALRLAVKLRLVIHVWEDGESVSTAKTLRDGDEPPDHSDAWHLANAHACGGIEAACRRSIVRAAAEIGRNTAKGDGGGV